MGSAMKLLCSSLLLLALVVLPSGCARKKPISDIDRKQAANLASEADFAVTVREYPRAEGLMVQATTLCPDTGAYWVSLGSARMRLGNRNGARDAYKHALSAFEDAAAKNKQDTEPALQQVFVLALLGRVDDARAFQERLLKQRPDNGDIRAFVEGKRLDALLNDPQYKQLAL